MKKNIINKEINKTINSLTSEEQEIRGKKQLVKFMSLDQYVEAITNKFPDFIKTDIENRITTLSGPIEEMSKRMNDFVLILDLLRNVKKEISDSKISTLKKQEYGSLVSEKQKEILKLTNDILEYRRLNSLEEDFINKQVVSVALNNIRQKHLIFITEDTTTLEANIKVILNEIHIVLVDQLYKEENAIIQNRMINDRRVKHIQYPHPKKLWNSTNININLDNAEGQIHNIAQYMQLLDELRNQIMRLPNIKRVGQISRKDYKDGEKFNKTTFETMKKKLINVIDDSTKKFVKVLLNPYFELIKSQNNNVVNYFNYPYIKRGDDMVYVYDVIHEFSALFRDTSKSTGMELLFKTMYEMIAENIKLFDGQGGRLERVKMINWIGQLEEKYNVDYYELKQKIAIDQIIHRIVLEKKKEKLKEITLEDILKSMPVPKKVDQAKEVKKIIKDIPKDKWSFIRKQILQTTWNSRKNEIPLSWYKAIAKPSNLDYLIVHFSGFFQQYQHIYGSYPFDLSVDTVDKLRDWQRKRIDRGYFMNVWVRHYNELNSKKFLLFNKETGLLDVDMNRARLSIEKLGEPVRKAYDNAVQMLERAKGDTEINTSLSKCRHEEIDDEIRLLILSDASDEQIQKLEKEKESCQIQAEDAMVCTLCGIKINQILDSAPETYDEMEQRRLNDQAEQMEVGYQELQREELEKTMISYIDNYMKQMVEKSNVSVQTVVSNLSESLNISRQEVDKIKRDLIMVIMTNERNIFNTVQSVYKKNLTTEISNQIVKTQIMNDILRMLVVIYFTRKFPNVSDGSKKGIQIMYANLVSANTSVNPELYTFEFRLNYHIRIYNQAVGIYNNSEDDQIEEDETEIMESNLDSLQEEELEIVTASFGIDKKSQEKMIKELKEEKKKEKQLIIKESDEILDKMMATSLEYYEKNFQRTLGLFTKLYDEVDTTLFAAIVSQHLGRKTNQQLKFSDFKNLFENLFYWSRVENENNPSFQEYKNKEERIYHPDISNINLLKEQRILFVDRMKELKQLLNYLEGLKELSKIDINDTDLKYMMINANAFIKGKKTEIKLKNNAIQLISSLICEGNASLVLVNGLLNNKSFKTKLQNLKQFESELNEKLQKVQKDMKDMKEIELLYVRYNKTEFLCPICPHSSKLNIDLTLHINRTHNFHMSDKLEVISPFQNKCPYCPFKGKKVYEHLKEIHLQLKDSEKLYKIGMEKRYESHLRAIWEKYGEGKATDRKMKNLDNKINMMELYQTYCDENTENNLKRHNFRDDKCIYCKRSVAKIAADAIGKKAPIHAQEMKEYIDMLNNRYCLKNDFRRIQENTDCSLSDFSVLLPVQDQWHLLRKNKFIEKAVVDAVIRKIDMFKQSLFKKYNQIYTNSRDIYNEKLDIIDQLKDVEVIEPKFIFPYDGLDALSHKYRVLPSKTIKQIFRTKDILKWDKVIKAIGDPSGNKTIKEGKQKIREMVIDNAAKWLENNATGDLKEFENLVGVKLPIMDMEKYDLDLLKQDRTTRLSLVIRNVILNLSKLNLGILNPYMHNSYLLSQRKNQVGGFKYQAPLDIYKGGKFDGNHFRGLLLQAPLELFKGGSQNRNVLIERGKLIYGGNDMYHGLPITNINVYQEGPEIQPIEGIVGGKSLEQILPNDVNVLPNSINNPEYIGGVSEIQDILDEVSDDETQVNESPEFYDIVQKSIRENIRSGNIDFIRQLIAELEEEPDERINLSDLLYFAAEFGQINIARLLIENGADINMKHGELQNTPLHIAVIIDDMEMIELLLENGANKNIVNRYGYSPISLVENEIARELFNNISNKLPKRIDLDINPTKKCKEDINIISQQKWEDEDLEHLIYIKWPKRTDCYLADDLQNHLKQSERMMIWRKNRNGRTIDNVTGRGWEPNVLETERYISLYPIRNWVSVSSLKRVLRSKQRDFTAILSGKARLGNENGTFGVSQKHAQEEEELWDIIPLKSRKLSSSLNSINEEDNNEEDVEENVEEDVEEDVDEDVDEDVQINLGPITSSTQLGGNCGGVCTI